MNRFGKKRPNFLNNPARVIVSSFALLILAGALVLTLPVCSRSGTFTDFFTTLFTATSASCVTGLVVVDTGTFWTPFGQGVILALIQLGGLGIVTFTTFFNIALRKRMALHTMKVASEQVSAIDLFDARKLISSILVITLSCEAIGAFLLGLTFVPQFGSAGIYYSIFIAVSAFCNAGFDQFGFLGEFSSLTCFAENPAVILPIAALIIFGGLGFIVWYDLIMFHKNRRLILHTKVVLITTFVLLVVGTVLLLIFEWNNPKTIGGMDFGDKLTNAFFQSTTTRTAGFNSIDNGAMTSMSKMLSILLMFIGAAPGSTGGGIKVTSFVVILMTVFSVIRNKNEAVVGKRRVAQFTVYKAITVTTIAIFAIGIATLTIYFTNDMGHSEDILGINALFESVSAFSTVGLTTGVTAVSNEISRIVLILTMFLGRVGPISLALSITANMSTKNKSLVIPEGKIIVG